LGEIKQNIDSKSFPSFPSWSKRHTNESELIDKDYMEREGGTYVYVA
jgi:hypothetical protein